MADHVVVGTGGLGTRFLRTDWPHERGLEAGSTVHLIDEVDYDGETQ